MIVYNVIKPLLTPN